jgi:hypothetical protein
MISLVASIVERMGILEFAKIVVCCLILNNG